MITNYDKALKNNERIESGLREYNKQRWTYIGVSKVFSDDMTLYLWLESMSTIGSTWKKRHFSEAVNKRPHTQGPQMWDDLDLIAFSAQCENDAIISELHL